MEALKQIIEKSSGQLIIALPEAYQNKKLEVIVQPIEEKAEAKLADFFGVLKWEGDALAEQKRLRDEWD